MVMVAGVLIVVEVMNGFDRHFILLSVCCEKVFEIGVFSDETKNDDFVRVVHVGKWHFGCFGTDVLRMSNTSLALIVGTIPYTYL